MAARASAPAKAAAASAERIKNDLTEALRKERNKPGGLKPIDEGDSCPTSAELDAANERADEAAAAAKAAKARRGARRVAGADRDR